ncbi:MAG: hypothetical protein JJU13_08300 [Balneolaceae bacterium]|nr:hypothetical protein [Balneolaceae bacterium]
MKLTLRKITDGNKKLLGAIITTNTPRNADAKVTSEIENRIINYAFDKLFKNESLSVFKSIYSDIISITFIRNINELEQETIEV